MEERRNGRGKDTNQLITFLKDNHKMALIILVAVVLVLLVLIIRSCGSGGGEGTGETSGEIIVGEEETEATRSAEDYALKQDAIPELNELVNTYFQAMKDFDAETYTNIVAGDDMTAEKLRKKGEFIEDYQNISCYTKPGMSDGDYVAYVYYEVKFHNVDTLCPALIQLYICTNEDGSMYINAGSLDAELAGYINTVSNDEDVRLLKEETNQKMNEAMASDEKLNLVMTLKASIDRARYIIDNANLYCFLVTDCGWKPDYIWEILNSNVKNEIAERVINKWNQGYAG